MGDKIDVKKNTGIISTGANSHNTIMRNDSKEMINNFFSDVAEAIKRINGMAELEEEQKKYLASIMNEAKTATEENNEDKEKNCKEKFEAFKIGALKVADKVISVLADLTTIAAFFGFGVK